MIIINENERNINNVCININTIIIFNIINMCVM